MLEEMATAGVPVEICFSLDTCPICFYFLNNVKAQIIYLIQKLHAKIPGVRFAIFAEFVLKEVQSLSWTPGSNRALVMIGNGDPHEPGYTCGPHICNVDWRDETNKLMLMVYITVKIMSVGGWEGL